MEKEEKIFPNGFTNWMETHYEIVMAIEQQLNRKEEVGMAWDVQKEYGMGGRYELSEALTDKFELKYKDIIWGEELIYWDEMDKFIKKELYYES